MYTSCQEKQEKLKAQFAACPNREAIYEKIMEWGRLQPSLSSEEKVEENLVQGCQSRLYLVASFDGYSMHFKAESDALISSGLAQLLVTVYEGESPEAILFCPPLFLEELNITALLSPSRSNGLHSLYLKMKRLAIGYLTKK